MSSDLNFQGNARFEVRRVLGQGGMGAVYEAIDHERGALVALKTLSRMNPVNIEQFKNEFRGLAGVIHPNLVRLHELIADKEHWLFTMDLVDGVPFIQHVRSDARDSVSQLAPDAETREQGVETIQGIGAVDSTRARGGKLDEALLRQALSQLASGVHAIHLTGKVHRDVKHSNVLVDRRGRVVILDFGLLTDAATHTDRDALGAVWGTPAYMSPEQAIGRAATAASDWYAVGVMLYEALTGRLPFAGSAQEVLLAKQQATPIAPSIWVKDVAPDLEGLCMQMLSFRPEDRPTGHAILSILGVREVNSEYPYELSSPPRFVGRQREVNALRNALQHPVESAQVVVVEGLSGIGKSALVEEVIAGLRRMHPNLMVLSGRCYARESVPFKAFDGLIDALAHTLNTLPEVELATLIPPGASALLQMFPALMRATALSHFTDDEPLPADPKELRRRAFNCLRGLFDRVARAYPLLIYVDDLQWGDEDSARLWIDLLADPGSPPLSLLCTFRSDERVLSPCLRVLLGPDGLAERVSLNVHLQALPTHEIVEIASGLLPRDVLDRVQQALTHESGGNPYFALELARELRSRSVDELSAARPVSLEHALAHRIQRLSEPTQELLRVVSVAARPLDQKVAFLAADLGFQGLSSLTELQNAHLVRLLGSHNHLISAYHDRIRETVFDGLSATSLKRIHGALATTFETRGDVDPESMTEHLVGAGELPRAARYAVVAAEQAAHALAFGRAARLYRVALDHTTANSEEREQWRVAMAEAWVNAGRGADAARVYLDAANDSSTRGPELRRRGAEQLILSGHIDEGIAVLGDVLRQCGLELPAPGQALVQTMELASRLRDRGLVFEPKDASQLLPETALRLEVCWAVALGFTGSEPERLMPVVLQHLLDALDAGSAYHVQRALCLFIGNGAVATKPRSRTIASALAAAEGLSSLVNAADADAWVLEAKGMINFLSRGDAAQALPCFEEAEATFRSKCRGVSREIGMAQVGILASMAELGRIGEYQKRYPSYLKDAEERSDLYLTMYYRSYHSAPYYLAADDPNAAWEQVESAVRSWGRTGFDQCALFSLLSRMEILVYRGGTEALQWAQEHGPAFFGSILATGHYFRARFFSLRGRAAVLSMMAGGDHQILGSQVEQDLVELEQSELMMAPGLALALRAALQSVRGERVEAMATLDRLVGVARSSGDSMLATCARLQLARLTQDPSASHAVEAAIKDIRAQNVRDPERWAALYVPVST